MLIEELTEVIKSSGLLPYEIAEAVYEALTEELSNNLDYKQLSDIANDSNDRAKMLFYLAAKQLKD